MLETSYIQWPPGETATPDVEVSSKKEGKETKGEKLVNAEESKKVVAAAEAQRNAARFEEFALSIANLIH